MDQMKNSTLANTVPCHWCRSFCVQRYIPIALVVAIGLMLTALILRMANGSEWQVVAAGISFTALFAAYLVIITSRASEVERLVAERTEELKRQIAERQQAETKIHEQYLAIQVYAAELEAANEELQQTQQKLLEANQNLETNVKERTAELKSANNDLEAFSYSVAHDLRAPLRHIIGFSRILQNEYEGQLPEDARRYLRKISDSASNLGNLVDGLLNLSRIRQTDLAIRAVNLNGIINDAIEELNMEETGRDIDLRCEKLPEVRCDPVLMKLVIQNLLSNAIKFTRNTAHAVIEIKHLPDGKPGFIIKDNGVGFDMRYADKLFGVFERLHKRSNFEGTGIGLATVKRIVTGHNGRVWAESAANEGAAFFVELPT